MRLTQILKASNWRYALGEVSLIVVGVTIALAATSWYESAQDRKVELAVLSQLRTSLENDRDDLLRAFEVQKQTLANISRVVEIIDGPEILGRDSDTLFGSLPRWRSIVTNTGAYEALKSRGFDLIENEAIRLRLIEYYEDELPRLLNTYLNDRDFVRSNVVPYLKEYFRQERGFVYIPLDYGRVEADPRFRNLCMTKINRIERFGKPSFARTLELIDKMLGEIEKELASR